MCRFCGQGRQRGARARRVDGHRNTPEFTVQQYRVQSVQSAVWQCVMTRWRVWQPIFICSMSEICHLRVFTVNEMVSCIGG